jgi:hypothetical protein
MSARAILLAIGLALAAVASAQAPVSTDTESEIVVTAQVERASLTLGRDADGRTTCSLSRSSGDPAIDSALCKRASRCIKPGAIDVAKLDACIVKQKSALVAGWMKGVRS